MNKFNTPQFRSHNNHKNAPILQEIIHRNSHVNPIETFLFYTQDLWLFI